MAAHFAASLRQFGYLVRVIDCFGIDSSQTQIHGDFFLLGIDESQVLDLLEDDTSIVYVYCRTIEDLLSSEWICAQIRENKPFIKICMFENIQTVNSFSLKEVIGDFLKRGIVDVGIFGEPEDRASSITDAISSGIGLSEVPGIAYIEAGQQDITFTNDTKFNSLLDELPFPAWDLFQLDGYWKCGYAHAPISRRKKFLPLLTSRGCPYRCVSPAINPKWRSRSAKNVVDEMEFFHKSLGVLDFHISDLDPTISETRTREISQEIIERRLKVEWKIAQGTKIETVKQVSTLELMRNAGCVFFSFSPESGSDRLLQIMNKRFDQEHALMMTKAMSSLGIRTQACFIAGVPGETKQDRRKTYQYVRKLVISGVDEIAVSIFTPIPGAVLGSSLSGFSHYSELSHSPAWRSDYSQIQRYRYGLYLNFFLAQAIARPFKFTKAMLRALSGNTQTKMEMSLRKFVIVRVQYLKAKIQRACGD
jgi:radical SAM superfamily enzyme YgiQ (UPF0313 family)